MSFKTRFAIFIGFVILFFVTAPLVVLYTAGFRWNFKKDHVEKIGLLFVRTTPSGATVLVDGNETSDRTPARVRDLLPGAYEVAVSKEGYTPWHKRLTIESERTTFAEHIVLFKNSTPRALAITARHLIPSVTSEYAVLLHAEASGTIAELFRLSDGNRRAFYRTNKQVSVDAGFSKNGDRVYIAERRGNTILAAASYAVSDPGTQTIVNTDDPLLANALDHSRRVLGSSMVATDGYGVYVDDAEGNRQTLTRLSTEIVSALPHPIGAYAFYQTKNEIHAIEFDGRDERNDVVLASGEGMNGMAIDQKGEALYFVMEKEGTPTVYKLMLQ